MVISSPKGALLLGLLLACPAPAQRQPDRRLDHTTAIARLPRLAAVDDGIYVVWEDYRNGGSDIFFNRSLDRGLTWLGEDRPAYPPTLGSLAYAPDLAAAGTSVFVAWEDFREGIADVYCSSSLDGGTSWLPPRRLDTDAAGSGSSQGVRAVAAASTVVVAWEDARAGASDIHCNRSVDGGVTWLAADVRLDGDVAGAADSFQVDLAVTGSVAYAAWSDARAGATDILLCRSMDGGATWSAPQRIDTDPAGAAESRAPRLATSGDAVFVVWEDDRDGGSAIRFNRSLDRGVTWMADDGRLDTAPLGPRVFSSEVRIATEGDAVYVAWQGGASSLQADMRFNRSLDRGATWLAQDVQVNRDPGGLANHILPALAVVGDSVYLAWQDYRDLSAEIYLNRSADRGTTWLPRDLRLNTDPVARVNHKRVALAATAAGVFAAWEDDRRRCCDIYFTVPFAVFPYGEGTAGTGAVVPALSSAGEPTLGSRLDVTVSGGLGGSMGAWIFSGARTRLPLLGGELLVEPEVAVPLLLDGALGSAGAGAATLPLSIPSVPGALGRVTHVQALMLDAGAPGGVAMSNGLEIWTG
ncbi:MAG: sialidase family protein [Planctomycetota bacterium]